jgi:hypothetical protein
VGGGAIEIGRANDPLEHAADEMAVRGSSKRVLRRQTAAPATPPQPVVKTQFAGQKASPAALANASKILGTTALKVDAATLTREAAFTKTGKASRLILHDTSGGGNAAEITHELRENRGPLGKGVTAWAPRNEGATLTRPFFETFRPTTTEWEKGLDAFKTPEEIAQGKNVSGQVLKDRRDPLVRKAWAAADAATQQKWMNLALGGEGLTAAELKKETEGWSEKKEGKWIHHPGALTQLDAKKGKHQMFTSALWAADLLCFASRYQDPDPPWDAIREACKPLDAYFDLRNEQVSTTNTVEISQPGATAEGAKAGHQATCSVNNKFNQKFQTPSYSDTQYNSARDLYLRATAQTGVYPYITTHKAVDETYGGHCDPRCFNLGRLYNDIAAVLGHKADESLYGIIPTYGPGRGTAVWWDFGHQYSVCGEAQPK